MSAQIFFNRSGIKLDSAKLQSSKQTLSPTAGSLTDRIHQARTRRRQSASKRGLRLSIPNQDNLIQLNKVINTPDESNSSKKLDRLAQRYQNKKNQSDSLKYSKEQHASIIYQSLLKIKHTQYHSIQEIFKIFCDNVRQLVIIKNERYAFNVMMKYSAYNPKIKEFLLQFDPHPSQWTPENLMKQLIQNQIDSLFKFNSEGFKKFRLDPQLIDAVIDLTKRIEENIIFLQEDRYMTMAKHLLEQNLIVNKKEQEVKSQMENNKRFTQMQYLQDLIKNRSKMNMRVLQTDIHNKLYFQEEKCGKFGLIHTMTRHNSLGLDNVISQIKHELIKYE